MCVPAAVPLDSRNRIIVDTIRHCRSDCKAHSGKKGVEMQRLLISGISFGVKDPKVRGVTAERRSNCCQ
jgi:hypothetical protein